MPLVISLISGLLFGAGLALSGMMNPAKVLNFLDFSGTWDATLGIVMAAALAVSLPAFMIAKKRRKPVFGKAFQIPTKTDLDPQLLTGAGIFGLGWGLVGFCPGPALSALSTGLFEPVVFSAAMIAGMFAHKVSKLG